jgi:tripartite-type tricarboxylate transporter receptor subunit TctC
LIFSPVDLGQPYLAPPGVSQERVVALRFAFASTMKDKEFLNDAQKHKFDIDPISAEDVTRSISEAFQASPEVVGKAKAAFQSNREKKRKSL